MAHGPRRHEQRRTVRTPLPSVSGTHTVQVDLTTDQKAGGSSPSGRTISGNAFRSRRTADSGSVDRRDQGGDVSQPLTSGGDIQPMLESFMRDLPARNRSPRTSVSYQETAAYCIRAGHLATPADRGVLPDPKRKMRTVHAAEADNRRLSLAQRITSASRSTWWSPRPLARRSSRIRETDRGIHDLEDPDRTIDTLERDLVHGGGIDVIPDRDMGSFRHQDLLGLCIRRKTRRQIDVIADDGVLGPGGGSDVSHRDISGTDPDSNVQVLASFQQPASTNGVELVLHLECGRHRSLGMVLEGNRISEEGEDAVANVLVEGATMAEDDVCHSREVLIQRVDQLLRLHAFGHRGEPPNVCEEDGQIASGRR